MKEWVAATAALWCADAAFAQTIVDGSGSLVPDHLRNTAISSVADKFKDPQSSQFRRIGGFPGKDPGSYIICGQVNAKNSYGGYVGFQFFMYVTNKEGGSSDLTDLKLMRETSPVGDAVTEPLRMAGCLP